MKTYLPFLLLFAGGSILTIGDIIMKKRVVTHQNTFFIAGMSIYMIGLFFLAQSFKFKNIAVASTIFVIFNIVTLLIFSYFYFKETLSPLQIIGIILGISSILFLELA